ncbi:PilT/PilU family type 4a pilus ATPase [Candidatus Uhrbacteria bacterium]|jgi:twitching motility protein PilT|nr:PilT/PilU family type 4a pilus ATPase [Candidatus Uhrbacteria bacterium]
MEELQKFVTFAKKKGASDLHLVSGALPIIRVHGQLLAINKSVITLQSVQMIAQSLLNQAQLKELDQSGDVDVGSVVGGIRLRINVHKHSGGLALAIRLIQKDIPTSEQLGFHPSMMRIPTMMDGLVVVSGPTGSGKSTTMASIVQEINQTSARHIITLEDPIEYRFQNAQSLIEQRQLFTHFPSFPKGLRHVLRQDPDVIVVGEMRDPETIALALTAAETGHLVLSTVHAPNASEVIERIVNVFEGAKQQQILVQLAATLKMVVSQHLVQQRDGGRVAAREILTTNLAVQNAIRQNNLSVVRSAIQTGKKDGMISMDLALKALKKQGLID